MKEYLLKYGYTEEDIQKYLEEEKMVELEGDCVIVDPVLFTDFVELALSNGLNLVYYFSNNKEANNIMYHVFKYIDLKMYREAQMLLITFIQQTNSYYGKILLTGLEIKYSNKDVIEYMIDESQYDSDVVIENMKMNELALLTAIELEDYSTAYTLIENIQNIYAKHQEPLPFTVMAALVKEIKSLETNHRKTSKHVGNRITGDSDSVIYRLLSETDYYRLETFIKEELESHNRSIKYEIYNILLDRIMFLNKCNVEYVKDTMAIDVQSKPLSEVLKLNHIPDMDEEFINNLLNPPKIEEEPNVNYYQVYKKLYKERDFVGAKEALIKFDRTLKRMGIYKNIDYELNELDAWIENIKDLDDESRQAFIDTYEDSLKLIKEKKYNQAINLLLYLYSYGSVPNYKLSSLIGLCYFEQKDYVLAVEYYSKARDGYRSPEDIYNLIYSYFKLGNYKAALKLVPKYEHYYPEENVKLHYIESICYVKLHEYASAIDSLETCEAMNVLNYNMPIAYEREKQIIKKILNGKKIDCYTENDFVDYELTNEEKKLAEDISSGEISVSSIIRKGSLNYHSLNDKIEYLFSCAKVYLQMKKEKEGKELCRFIQTLITDPRLEKEEKETFTLRLKNYTSI